MGNELSPKQLEICTSIVDLNMIRQYPLSKDEIEHWAKTITRLKPDVSEEIISKVVDMYLSAEWDWEPEKGIQNIFNGIIELTEPNRFRSGI